jgi:adenine-specific DNA-methyltransferase
VNDQTRPWLTAIGNYCVVRRFSSKEEQRRIVAQVIEPHQFPEGTEFIGLENHLNVFHQMRRGLPVLLAHGLACYLNSTAFDDAFRRFSGHTQVNSGDLRAMRYPDRPTLEEMGRWAIAHPEADQPAINACLVHLAG